MAYLFENESVGNVDVELLTDELFQAIDVAGRRNGYGKTSQPPSKRHQSV